MGKIVNKLLWWGDGREGAGVLANWVAMVAPVDVKPLEAVKMDCGTMVEAAVVGADGGRSATRCWGRQTLGERENADEEEE